MYCPQCRGEYRPGFSQCADCEVSLVEKLEEPVQDTDVRLVTVLEVVDPSLLALAESLLRAENVPFLKQGEQLQELWAWGRIGGFSPVAGPILIQVPEEYAEAAAEILQDIEVPPPAEE
jgi:hypothetical protein